MLTDYEWQGLYTHEMGDLVAKFYIPALAAAKEYDRLTGFFKASSLAVAARGLEGLIANDGRMRLIVGCTLDPPEIEAIERGYDMRQLVEQKLLAMPLDIASEAERAPLECLATLIYHGHLDIKVAVPVDEHRRPIHVGGIFHEKLGILTDEEGNRLVFHGSINESETAWVLNRESFSAFCSWRGEDPAQRINQFVNHFTLYWEGNPPHTVVYPFTEALNQKLLQFLPHDPHQISPPLSQSPAALPPGLLPEEKRQAVGTFLTLAPRFANALQLGAATAPVSGWPHQIRSYSRFIQQWPSRILIADEVGLGKTISAGLILRQAWLSGLAPRILLLAPRSVLTQWQGELNEKFNLRVPIYDGDGAEFFQQPITLASSHLMRRRDRRRELIDATPWNLIILDEAHHARRKGAGSASQEGPNALLSLMRDLAPLAKSLLLLTATPMQVAPIEVFDLASLLGLPAAWQSDPGAFDTYFTLATANPADENLEYLARLYQSTMAHYGPLTEEDLAEILTLPKPQQRSLHQALLSRSTLERKHLRPAQRQALAQLLPATSPLRHLMIRNTRSLLRAYKAAGKIDGGIAQRDPRDITIPMSPAEERLYKAVEGFIKRAYNQAALERGDKRSAIGFILTIYRRRLASSFFALRRTLLARLSRLQDPATTAAFITPEDATQDDLYVNASDAPDLPADSSDAVTVSEVDELKSLLALINLDVDSKVIRLKAELSQAFEDGFSSAIVFTQYTDTLEYLCGHLQESFPQMQIGTYSGDGGRLSSQGAAYDQWPIYKKDEIKRRLKRGEISILVCTDAAAEGLNLQTCGLLVNYDLPWNPMRVEQRIGRIDRIGQRYETIRIINFAYKGTVEEDVFFTVGQRINLFQGVIGKLQPILSMLPKMIEEATLRGADGDEGARQRFIAEIEAKQQSALDASFDIDQASERSLEMPALPPPPFTQHDLDRLFTIAGLMPTEWEVHPADARSWFITPPGAREAIRITTDPEVFEISSESMRFFSPGGELYDQFVAPFAKQDSLPVVKAENNPPARVWVAESTDAPPQFLTIAPGSTSLQSITYLSQLFTYLEAPPPAQPFPNPAWAGVTVRVVL